MPTTNPANFLQPSFAGAIVLSDTLMILSTYRRSDFTTEWRGIGKDCAVTQDLFPDEVGTHAHFCDGGPRESGEFRF
jgi:hypothetical protein